MREIRFSWDRRKGAANVRKHRVSFEEAQTVFADEHALMRDDPDHSTDEDRLVLLGMSAKLRILVVVHAVRSAGGEVRLISARKATRNEAKTYAERWRR